MTNDRIRIWAIKLASDVFDTPTKPAHLLFEDAARELVNEALEEAAKVCDARGRGADISDFALRNAALAIRSLKVKP